jgi:hypothetical protein
VIPLATIAGIVVALAVLVGTDLLVLTRRDPRAGTSAVRSHPTRAHAISTSPSV